MTPPASHDGDARSDLDRFLDALRRTGTVVRGPVDGDPDDPDDQYGPVEWLVTAHRGTPADPPYRLVLDDHEFRRAVERDARVIERWWPGGDARARAYGTPHAFLLEREDHLHLTTQHPCPDPELHLDPAAVEYEGSYGWFGYEPGTPEFEEERAQHARQSRHRRHSYLVLGRLEVEAAYNEVFQRFTSYVDQNGSPSSTELSEIMHAEDERFDAFLDALVGESRDD